MRGFVFTPQQIGDVLDLLGLPLPGQDGCPVREAPVSSFDGGGPGETALTVVADDFREALALAMQLAALVCDPEEVADLHTRMIVGLDPLGRPRYQFRGYHVHAAVEALAEAFDRREAAGSSPAA